MKKPTLVLLVLLTLSLPARAEDWSLRVATGAFVFGDFVERTLLAGTETGSEEQTLTLSAATRPGVAVDLERGFSDRFAVRLEGTFARAPLAIKGDDDDGVEIEAGELDVATFSMPLVFRLNPRGTFRFHLFAGPAYAGYRITARENSTSSIRTFRGTRQEWGLAVGGGVGWHWSESLAVEGELTDVATASPFRDTEIGLIGRTSFPRPHNVHTTVGLRWKF